MVVFARIAEELDRNGFEVEPFGPQTLAVKAAPVGLEGAALERMLAEVIEQSSADSDEPKQNEDLTALRTRIAASIACHSAIKINTALDQVRMEWLLSELAKTSHPTSCPHGDQSLCCILGRRSSGPSTVSRMLGRWLTSSQE